MAQIGIRELRQHASKHVAAAAAGEEIIVTDRGKPVARLVPLSPLEREIQYLVDKYGAIPPAGPPIDWSTWEPVATEGYDGPSMQELLDEQRADRDYFAS